MAYEVYEHAGSFIVINRHTGEDAGLVTPIVSEALSDDAEGPGKLPEANAYEIARRFPSRADAEEWLAKAF